MLLRAVAALALALGLAAGGCGASDEPRLRPQGLAAHAADLRRDLVEGVLPYWYDTAQDRRYGGYLLADDGDGPDLATEKLVVSQARMVWAFSHAARHGIRDPRRDYLAAAEHGYRFLLRRFRDPVHGGYVWRTTPSGDVLVDHKYVYGQAFVVYAFVEYARASGEREPLRHALELYELLQRHAHDRVHGGWLDHFRRDWTPILLHDASVELEIGGLKSGNVHLHLLEAFTELYAATRDERVGRSLAELVRVTTTHFFPRRPGASAFHRAPDWSPAPGGKPGLSYGHNVEFAWLLVRAQRALGRPPSWGHFYAHLDHALAHGYDHERGGLYELGAGDAEATDTDKVWWPQAEMVAALTVALEHRDEPRYRSALAKLLDFVRAYLTDPDDGVWIEAVEADGSPQNPAKAHVWKANYHDVRALVLFTEAFG